MDRTSEFFSVIGEEDGVAAAARVLKKATPNHFNEASYNIANLVNAIQQSVRDNNDQFIDQYGAILSRKSSMSEEERALFVAETNASVSEAEQLISDLASNVNSGKLGLIGNGIDHSVGVFSCLDFMLSGVKKEFALMRARRENIKIQAKTAARELVKSTFEHNPTRTEPARQEIDNGFEQKLELEHQSVVNELLEFHDQLVRTESLAEEVATMQKIYSDMITEQTEKIRVIRSEVEEAAKNYEEGAASVRSYADKAKFQHLWVSVAIYIISLLLLVKQIREDLRYRH